jgi:hypothetical protein
VDVEVAVSARPISAPYVIQLVKEEYIFKLVLCCLFCVVCFVLYLFLFWFLFLFSFFVFRYRFSFSFRLFICCGCRTRGLPEQLVPLSKRKVETKTSTTVALPSATITSATPPTQLASEFEFCWFLFSAPCPAKKYKH